MRLLVWNVHKGIGGLDRRYRPERILEVLRHHGPDLALLQEVDDGAPRSRRDRQAESWAEALGYRYSAFGPNVRLRRGRWGNAILSRHPLSFVQNLDLTFPPKKRRGALCADVHLRSPGHDLSLHVVNVHLGLSGLERRWQIRRVLGSSLLAPLDLRSRIVIGGDTNDWAGALARGALRRAGFACVTGRGARAIRTYPAWSPVGPLDRVYLRGPLRCRHASRSRLRLARLASDHLPVILDLDLLPP